MGMKTKAFVVHHTVVSLSILIVLSFLSSGAGAAVQTEARVGVLIHNIDLPDSEGIHQDDPNDADTGLFNASRWSGTISARAKAHAEYRNLKAYATINYSAGSTPLSFESGGAAHYTDEIQFAPLPGFGIMNPDENYSVELVFHAGGTKEVTGFFMMEDCYLTVSSSIRGSNQEPNTQGVILGDEGDYHFTISGYHGDLIDLKVTLDAEFYVGYKKNVNGQGTLDFFHTLNYTGATLRDSQEQVVAAFDADNKQVAGEPGWTIVPAGPETESVIFGLKSRSNNTGGAGEYLTPATLYSFRADGSPLNEIGPVTRSGTRIPVDGLAFSPNNRLWCFELTSSTTSTLYRLDPATAEVNSAGIELPNRQIFGAAFDRRGQLWAIDQTNDQLLRIDCSTGTILQQTSLMLDGAPFGLNNASGDICFDPMGNAYLVDFEFLYRLNVHTGELIKLFQDKTPYAKFLVGAAIPANHSEWLIGFDVTMTSIDNDDLFVYNLGDLKQPDYLFKSILNSYNAGRGDLATVVPTDLIVSGNFDTGPDGWTGAALSISNLSQVVQILPITYSDGHISVTDTDNQWTTFAAPAAYLGDKSDWLGGQIELDMLHSTSGERVGSPAVFLVSQGIVLCSPEITPMDSWQHYSVSLIPQGWHINTPDGAEPTMGTFYSVVSNLEAMYIIGDYVSGVETTSIDNVQMRSGLSPDSTGDGFVNMEDLAQFAAQWLKEECANPDWCDGQDFTKNGRMDLDDLYILLPKWLQEVR
jgi:hypothetical protein